MVQSQRDCITQPRVAESARLPWIKDGKWIPTLKGLRPNAVLMQLMQPRWG